MWHGYAVYRYDRQGATLIFLFGEIIVAVFLKPVKGNGSLWSFGYKMMCFIKSMGNRSYENYSSYNITIQDDSITANLSFIP